MIAGQWPMLGLVSHTPRLELRVPGLDVLAELAVPAIGGAYDPAVRPFRRGMDRRAACLLTFGL
jgi:hypothetical protein